MRQLGLITPSKPLAMDTIDTRAGIRLSTGPFLQSRGHNTTNLTTTMEKVLLPLSTVAGSSKLGRKQGSLGRGDQQWLQIIHPSLYQRKGTSKEKIGSHHSIANAMGVHIIDRLRNEGSEVEVNPESVTSTS